jgi:hypothetical protein
MTEQDHSTRTTKKHAAAHHETNKEDTMKKTTAKHAHVHATETESATAAVVQTEASPTPDIPAATPPPPVASGTASTASPATPLVFLQPPPADANIPKVPAGATSLGASAYRGVMPKALELAALQGAVEDLKRFTNFEQVFALTGLKYAQVLQAFEVGAEWSSMRAQSDAWDRFSLTQQGISWTTIRAMINRIQAVLEPVTTADPSLVTTFPSFATLLGAKKVIAKKGAAVRRLNNAAIARGEAPVHGVVGKKRQRAAQKAAAAAAKSAGASTPPTAPAPAANAATPVAPAAATNGAPQS